MNSFCGVCSVMWSDQYYVEFPLLCVVCSDVLSVECCFECTVLF